MDKGDEAETVVNWNVPQNPNSEIPSRAEHPDHLSTFENFEVLLKALQNPRITPPQRQIIEKQLHTNFSAELTERAANHLRDKFPTMSANSSLATWQRNALLGMLVAIIVGLSLSTTLLGTIALGVIFIYCISSTVLKGLLMVASLQLKTNRPAVANTNEPVVTVLLPVRSEGAAIATLIAELQKIDYPSSKLDLKVLVEEDDDETRKAIERLDLPSHFEFLIVPVSEPQTKPKAMNYALPFVKGDIVGIYDAEDAPEPDQIRKLVRSFADADPRTVCIQCRLNHYNATENFLSRMASLEYTLWFDVLLQGLSKLRLPVPLGGTSLFVRTQILRKVGGWDPYNVTEDADLGIRLARNGYRAEVIDSTTWEEPPVKFKQWFGQRSRWIKGFMVTWLVHMKNPENLRGELGTKGFLAINIMLLDGFVAFLLLPIFWIAILGSIFFGGAPWSMLLEVSVFSAIAWIFALGQIFILTAAFVGAQRRFGFLRATWSPLLWFYWQLAAYPAYIALVEMFGQQSAWRKTPHGLSKEAKKRIEQASKPH